MRIVVVGTGRVGSVLAANLGLTPHLSRGQPLPSADVYLLAVTDHALAEVAARLPSGGVALHTAGALGPVVLGRPVGVFHPLMTFPGAGFAPPDLTDVPVRLGGDDAALAAGRIIAAALRMRPFVIDGDPRLYHAAAVMAGNFATVLLAEAARVLTAAGVPAGDAPALLAPLALASLRNAAVDPGAALTGPAARGDRSTARDHRLALEAAGLTSAIELYDLLSNMAFAMKSAREGIYHDTT